MPLKLSYDIINLLGFHRADLLYKLRNVNYLLRKSDAFLYSLKEKFFDGQGKLRNPGETYLDKEGIAREPGEDYFDYLSMLRKADEEFYDSQGVLRKPDESFYDGNGILCER